MDFPPLFLDIFKKKYDDRDRWWAERRSVEMVSVLFILTCRSYWYWDGLWGRRWADGGDGTIGRWRLEFCLLPTCTSCCTLDIPSATSPLPASPRPRNNAPLFSSLIDGNGWTVGLGLWGALRAISSRLLGWNWELRVSFVKLVKIQSFLKPDQICVHIWIFASSYPVTSANRKLFLRESWDFLLKLHRVCLPWGVCIQLLIGYGKSDLILVVLIKMGFLKLDMYIQVQGEC